MSRWEKSLLLIGVCLAGIAVVLALIAIEVVW